VTDTPTEVDYRFTLANERTFLAWIRTALALIAGGVALIVLPSFGVYGLRHGLSALLIAFGGVLAWLAVRRWRQVQDAMEAGEELPPSRIPVVLAAAMLVTSAFALVLLLFAQN
jgi:putative membrane protein